MLAYLLLDLHPVKRIGNTLKPNTIKKKKNLLLNITLRLRNGVQIQIANLNNSLSAGLITKTKIFNFLDITIERDKSPSAYLNGCKIPPTPT